VFSHPSLAFAQLFILEASAQHCQDDKDFDPDMLSGEGIYTDSYTICCVVLQLKSSLKTTAGY
jgi:hypothetical protein